MVPLLFLSGSSMIPLLFLYGSSPVSLWFLSCFSMVPLLFLYGSSPASLWFLYGSSPPTLRKESREPFSMYSVMIITGLPGKKYNNNN